jgi:hypothetical protein
MSESIKGILIGGGSTLFAAFIIWAIANLRHRISLPNNVGQLRRGEYAIFQVLEKQGLCLAAILGVNETILNVIQDGKINGNIMKAVDKNTLGGKHLETANEIAHEFLHAEAVGDVSGK